MAYKSWLSLFSKDVTAGDVHVSSSGGKGKRKTFRDLIGDKKPKLPDDENADIGKVEIDASVVQKMHDLACQMGAECADDNDDDTLDDATKRDGSFSIPFKISKADADQQMIFGWASIVEKDGKLVIDKQEDFILPEDLEAAAYDYVLNSRTHGHMHVVKGTGRLIESMVFTKEKQDALGIDLKKVGWWCGWHVSDAEVWAAHKRGELPELSIGGSGRRTEV